jgi:hypothetical protein
MHGPLLINAQQQAGHIRGTPQYLNRIKQGKPTSTFINPGAATIRAWQVGQPVGLQGNLRILEFGKAVGVGPAGVKWPPKFGPAAKVVIDGACS